MIPALGAIATGKYAAVLTPLRQKRCLTQVYGKDSYELLNALSTQKIPSRDDLYNQGNQCLYGHILNNKGRVVADTMYYYRLYSQSWNIETDRVQQAEIMEHMTYYKLRKQVYFDNLVDQSHSVYSLLATNEETLKTVTQYILNQTDSTSISLYKDPRWKMSYRLVVPNEVDPLQTIMPGTEMIYNDSEGLVYNYARYLNGIPEGPAEIVPSKSMPHQVNCDMLDGLNLSKGCYLGQELIARTHHTGVVRKRLFPFIWMPGLQFEVSTIEGKAALVRITTPNYIDFEVVADTEQLIPSDMFELDEANQVILGTKPIFGAFLHNPPSDFELFPLIQDSTEPDLYGIDSKGVENINSQWGACIGMVRMESLEKSQGFFYSPKWGLFKAVAPVWYDKYLARQKDMASAVMPG